MSMVKFKLKNLELATYFESVNKDIQDMSETITKLQNFFSTETNKARIVVTTSKLEQCHKIKGVTDGDGNSILNKHLKRRSKDSTYQTFNKTPEIKELTNNFKLSVSYKDIFTAVFGDSSPINMINNQLYYKSVSYEIIDNGYYIEIESRDINDHVLSNYEEVQ